MARFVSPKVQTAGVYRALAVTAEQRLREWIDAGRGRSELDYPSRRIVEASRCGLPVNVPTGWLPDWARVGMPSRRGRLGLALIRPARAIVGPDDTVTWSDDDWAALWLEESGL
jgi:hypothetical protein